MNDEDRARCREAFEAIRASATDREAMNYAAGYADCLNECGIYGDEARAFMEAVIVTRDNKYLKRGMDTAALVIANAIRGEAANDGSVH